MGATNKDNKKPTKPVGKKKAAKLPPKENVHQYEDFHKLLAGLVTPVVPDKR